jgi:hypothetical protein
MRFLKKDHAPELINAFSLLKLAVLYDTATGDDRLNDDVEM